MTIDERLEALAQTMELMAHMQRDTEGRVWTAIAAVAEAQVKAEKSTDRLEQTVNRMGRYAMVIARDHESRLAALESDELDSGE